MKIAQSRITSQGQVSVPAEVRKRLALVPGSVIEWEAEDDRVTVRRAGKRSNDDVHHAFFPVEPARRTLKQVKERVEAHIRKKHAGR